MRIAIGICLISASFIVHGASRPPEAVLQDFYSWVLSKRNSSLPTSAERKRLASIFSRRLIELIAEAEQAEKRCIESVRGTTDKPYVFEVDVFIGNWGGADEVVYGDIEPIGDTATVNVTYFSINQKIPKGRRWRVEMWAIKVKMLADRVGKIWQIDDLQYENGDTLTSRFSKYLLESKEFCKP